MKQHSIYQNKQFSKELRLLISLSEKTCNIDSVLQVLPQINWNLFIKLVLRHRFVSHIFPNFNKIKDYIPKNILSRLNRIKINQSKRALANFNYIANLNNHFKANNIPHVFFKGGLLSYEIYCDIGFRNFNDIDVLVELKHIEKAKNIIVDLNFTCHYPKMELSKKLRKINYQVSGHYHFKHNKEPIEVDLHWNLTNPKSFFNIKTKDIILNSIPKEVFNHDFPYISVVENLVFQAAHGSIHQWYRLFWLKDFSMLLLKCPTDEIENAWELSKKIKLDKCFWQACVLSKLLFKSEIPDFVDNNKYRSDLIEIPIKSIAVNDMRWQGYKGKIKYAWYRFRLKADIKYHFNLIFRLRTHFTDWELLPLPDQLFFAYYILRPFFLIYRFMKRK